MPAFISWPCFSLSSIWKLLLSMPMRWHFESWAGWATQKCWFSSAFLPQHSFTSGVWEHSIGELPDNAERREVKQIDSEMGEWLVRNVRDILRDKGTAVHSISPDASVYDALKLMAEKNVGALLILDGDRLVGLVSERDYARKI